MSVGEAVHVKTGVWSSRTHTIERQAWKPVVVVLERLR